MQSEEEAARPQGQPPLPPALHPRGRRAGREAARGAEHSGGSPLNRRGPGRGRQAGSGPRRGVLGARLLAGLLSLAILTGTGYAWASYRHFTSGLTRVDAIPGPPKGKDVDGIAQNILLVGDDHRPANASPQELAMLSTGQDGGGTNTDTMMVLHLPGGHGNPTVISLPRDSWVDIPGFGKGKLNSAFAAGAAHGGGDAGGMRLLIQTIQNLTGLSIDHFVRVSMLGFYDIANVLGPIQVCLNHPARDSYSGTNLPAGVSTLNAKQALSFVRQRHGLLRGDLDREVRQQYFLSTELHKVLAAGTLLNPAKTQALLGAVSSALETDPGLDLLSLAGQFDHLSADKVTFTTIPVSGTPTITVGGQQISVVEVDFAALPGFINQILGTPGSSNSSQAAPSTAEAAPPVNPSTVTVQVVNATGRPGLAASQSADLSGIGFHTVSPGNAQAQLATTVTYPPDLRAQAAAVAAHVPGAQLQQSTAASRVVLTLGSDGVRVSADSGLGGAARAATSATPSAAPTQSFTTSSCIN